MRGVGWGITVMVLASVVAVELGACGDKFLVPGRGVRLPPSSADRARASVLIYAPATSGLASALSRLKTEAALRRVGYRPSVISEPGDLARAASTRWDAVLFEPAAAPDLPVQVATSSPVALMAVLHSDSKLELARLRSEYAMVLKSPIRNQDVLDALDHVAIRPVSARDGRAVNR